MLIYAGVGFGVFSALLVSFNYDADWVNAFPVLCGGLPFDIAFFAAGCIAKRSGWLEAIRDLRAVEYWAARVISLAIIIYIGVYGSIKNPSSGFVDCGSKGTQATGDFWIEHLNLLVAG